MTMFTMILFYSMIVMLTVGAVINFILWMSELKDRYKYSSMQKRILNDLAKSK